ncbi:DUF3616 domain-containing protein [Nitrosomonas communis]|uniref:DUF3616 domain-containing protein n=1 Tax=Nitrosomonas communis TaxID=44574 RepID=UPI003D2A6DC0
MNIKPFSLTIAITATFLVPSVIADKSLSVTQHYGMCDASAAVPVEPDMFIVANDEDNLLRIYKRDKSGEPIYSQDLSSFLEIDPKHREIDIEGATLIQNYIYWIASHGANKDGKERLNRHRFFATEIETIDGKFYLKPIGKPYVGLAKALDDSAELKPYQLGKSAKKAPESMNGLNIEGLTRTPQGNLLIGFRNPIPGGKALLVPLENPQEVITGNEQPKLGKPIYLALDGLGIRSIEYSDINGAYFIIAGPYDDNGKFQFYQWSGNSSEPPRLISKIDFEGMHPEALIVYPKEKNKVQILSDDGSKLRKGQYCKDLAQSQEKVFRSIWVNIEP